MNSEVMCTHLNSHPIFKGHPEKLLKELGAIATIRTINCGELIPYGDGAFSKIHFLIRGIVKISEVNDMQAELVDDILLSPDIFGDLSFDGRYSKDEYAEALASDTIICSFPAHEFKYMMLENPALAASYAGIADKKLKKLERRHSNLVARNAKTKLLHFIKDRVNADGGALGDKRALKDYFAHSNMAGVMTITLQTGNVMINDLKDSGMRCNGHNEIELNNAVAWN